LLNQAGAGIKEDGNCGRATISAIEEYQRNWSKHPDGRVDPGGATWKHLVRGAYRINRGSYSLLPQGGNGYYSYASMDRQFGTSATTAALLRIAGRFAAQYPGVPLGIGDMSFASGAEMFPHKTHRNGRNADIRPLRVDGKKLPVTIFNPEYSRERTGALVAIIRADVNFKSVLFNDSAIAGLTHWDGHHYPLHGSWKE